MNWQERAEKAEAAVPEEWREVMTELADDLAIEIDQSYPPERRAYPSEQRRYEREMQPVYRARAMLQSSQAALAVPEEWREKLIAEFPLFNDEGLCQEKHHCEWALQQDRKRLHALLQSSEVPK